MTAELGAGGKGEIMWPTPCEQSGFMRCKRLDHPRYSGGVFDFKTFDPAGRMRGQRDGRPGGGAEKFEGPDPPPGSGFVKPSLVCPRIDFCDTVDEGRFQRATRRQALQDVGLWHPVKSHVMGAKCTRLLPRWFSEGEWVDQAKRSPSENHRDIKEDHFSTTPAAR